jgi:hypothetical protein
MGIQPGGAESFSDAQPAAVFRFLFCSIPKSGNAGQGYPGYPHSGTAKKISPGQLPKTPFLILLRTHLCTPYTNLVKKVSQ